MAVWTSSARPSMRARGPGAASPPGPRALVILADDREQAFPRTRCGAQSIIAPWTLVRAASPRRAGPGVGRWGGGHGLLVPVWVAGSGPSEYQPLAGGRPLEDREPVWLHRALGPGAPAGPARSPHVVVGEQGEPG